MAQARSVIIAIIAALSAIICVSIFTGGLVDYKKSGGGSGITATGSASCDFESDLIVWRGSFSVHGDTPRDAYAIIKKDAELVRQYLEENQVAEDEMIFSSVNISQTYTSRYDDEGKYLGDEPDGYDLTQSLTVSSYDIDKVENISRDITKLIESGVEFESELPEYYYTTLDEVKLVFEDDALSWIAEEALKRGTGARALRAILEEFMLDIMYEIPKDPNIGSVVVTRPYLEKKGGPLIQMRQM